MKTFIIAEVAQSHDGSLGIAHSFIDSVAKTGVDAIKFQTHFAEFESSKDEPWRINFSYEDKSRFNYWKRMEFTIEQWKSLKDHAEKLNLEFMSSPFSIEAFDLLYEIGVKKWKIASGEVFNKPLIDKIIKTKKPIIFSTGLANPDEIDEFINYLNKNNAVFSMLKCTTKYPTPAEDINFDELQEYIQKYNFDIGLSDHSGEIFPSLSAVTIGAKIIEVHVTFHKEMFGPDVKSSLTLEQLKTLVQGIRFIEKMKYLNSPIRYDEEFHSNRKIFLKSIYTKNFIPKDKIISLDDLLFLKPLNGIPANKYDLIVGKKAKRDINSGALMTFEDIDV